MRTEPGPVAPWSHRISGGIARLRKIIALTKHRMTLGKLRVI